MAQLSLTKAERWILANQQQILAILNPSEKAYHERMQEALIAGYARDYQPQHMSDEASDEVCETVVHVLDMYRALRHAAKKHGLTDIDEQAITFEGFDGNTEGAYYGYARFLIEEPGHWDEFKSAEGGGDINSHAPMLDLYLPMVLAWRYSERPHELTEKDVRRILRATH